METEQVWAEIEAARLRLADFLDTLSPDDWEHPSLCPGWRVRDVAAHLTLAPQTTLGRSMRDFAKARGNFNRLVLNTAIEQAELPTGEIVGLLRSLAESRRTPPGTGPLTTILDVLTHTQDISRPLGREIEIPPAAARVGAERAWSIGWPFHARKRFGGFALVGTDSGWTAGAGPVVEGPTSAMLQLLTGRAVALERLGGDGVAELARTAFGRTENSAS
ncbi:maleylpyruvate isomerase family mycothiol-dependent enzyme [Actinokineospora sp.]|uniref:maleylpyruvate isomerase family mycothiol-dependent enzyme n=1 Tax=Actinokineospora sp. TaxID=1872133 RepID=UPI003D6A3EC4